MTRSQWNELIASMLVSGHFHTLGIGFVLGMIFGGLLMLVLT